VLTIHQNQLLNPSSPKPFIEPFRLPGTSEGQLIQTSAQNRDNTKFKTACSGHLPVRSSGVVPCPGWCSLSLFLQKFLSEYTVEYAMAADCFMKQTS